MDSIITVAFRSGFGSDPAVEGCIERCRQNHRQSCHAANYTGNGAESGQLQLAIRLRQAKSRTIVRRLISARNTCRNRRNDTKGTADHAAQTSRNGASFRNSVTSPISCSSSPTTIKDDLTSSSKYSSPRFVGCVHSDYFFSASSVVSGAACSS